MEKENLKLCCAYLRYRLIEILVWCGIPVVGAVLAGGMVLSTKFALFGLQMTCAMGHIIFLNDWGGLKRDPTEIRRYVPVGAGPAGMARILKTLSVSSFASAVVIGVIIVGVPLTLFFAAVGLALSVLYSHPFFHLKDKLIGSKIIHYLGGQFLFFIGYLSFVGEPVAGLYISVFFALILLGGHFIHEAADRREDSGKSKTWATVFGVRQAARIGWLCFVLAHGYWAVPYYLSMVGQKLFFLFSVPVLIHAVHAPLKSLERYRRHYRIIYGACTLIFIFQSI